MNTIQFRRICQELEIIFKSSSVLVFKPNVERENKTFKGHLVAELRHENIVEDYKANKYLVDIKTGEIMSYSKNTICTVIIAYGAV